jgi:DNA-binding IclR family transcriptional regulator
MTATKTEAVRPIRSLLRGLDVLEAVRGQEGLTVTEAARRVRLPRTTAYRILETLRAGGHVVRDDVDRYRAADTLAFGAARQQANGARDVA